MTITKDQLLKFCRKRNQSAHQTNLQFQIDAEECGFRIADIGDPVKTGWGYYWLTAHGALIERYGTMALLPRGTADNIADLGRRTVINARTCLPLKPEDIGAV